MKSYIKRMVSLMLVVAMCLSLFCGLAINANAATSGATGTTTIKVTTKPWTFSVPSEESITLEQACMRITYYDWLGKTKTKNGYWAVYNITVYDSSTGKKVGSYYWNGGKTKTIKSMSAGKTYRIVVSYNDSMTKTNTVMGSGFGNITISYSKPSWTVKCTNKVKSYS